MSSAADGAEAPAAHGLSHLFSPTTLTPLRKSLVATVPAARRVIGDDEAMLAAVFATARVNDVLVAIFERIRAGGDADEVMRAVLDDKLLELANKRLAEGSKGGCCTGGPGWRLRRRR